jgi:D-psicose/D-tagatose/L-ribulose 3-epimerase
MRTKKSLLSLALMTLVTACASSLQAAPAGKKILIGNTGSVDKLEQAKAAGFDYVELGARTVAGMTDDEFKKAMELHKKVGLPTPVANGFLPKEMKIVGPQLDKKAELEYVRVAFDRLSKLGVKIVVLGSGPSRQYPEGFAKEEALKQLVDYGKRIAPEAKKKGITVCVEPLQQSETNTINTPTEGLEWVKAVNHPNFQLMVDFYHLAIEKQDPGILVTAKKYIRHFHIANPKGRVYPLAAGEYDYLPWFENIARMGYSGGISIEAKTLKYEEEAPRAIALVRELLAQGAAAAKPVKTAKSP